MEWLSRRQLGITLGLALALAGLCAVVSFAPQDPTLTNLRYPKDGIGNWLGFPGALLAGSLVEGFGWAALLGPVAMVLWTLCDSGRPRLWTYILQSIALMVLAASWSGQWVPSPGLGLAGPGLIGWSGGHWARESLGPGAGGAVLTLGLLLSLRRQLYAPRIRAFLTLRALGKLFTAAGRREAGAWVLEEARRMRSVRWSVPGLIVLAPLHAIAAALLAVAQGLRYGALTPLSHLWQRIRGSAASLRGVRRRAAPARLDPRRPTIAPSAWEDRQSAFEGWLEPEGGERQRMGVPESWSPPGPTGAERLAREVRDARVVQEPRRERQPAAPEPPFSPAEPPAPGGAMASGAMASGAARWEQLLRRYRENLDLDWDANAWRGGRNQERDADERTQPKRPAE